MHAVCRPAAVLIKCRATSWSLHPGRLPRGQRQSAATCTQPSQTIVDDSGGTIVLMQLLLLMLRGLRFDACSLFAAVRPLSSSSLSFAPEVKAAVSRTEQVGSRGPGAPGSVPGLPIWSDRSIPRCRLLITIWPLL